MQKELGAPIKQIRDAITWYIHHDDDLNAVAEEAAAKCVPFLAFLTETPTRWSSGPNSWEVVINNSHAMRLGHAHKSCRPAPLPDDRRTFMKYICVVFGPLGVATRMLAGAGDKGLASMYLLIWHQVSEQYGNHVTNMPIPRALRDEFGPDMQVKYVVLVARYLREWLRRDLEMIKAKPIAGTSAHSLLLVASYSDPRHQQRKYTSRAEVEETKKEIIALAVHRADTYPQLAELMKAEAADTSNLKLGVLKKYPGPKSHAKRKAHTKMAANPPCASKREAFSIDAEVAEIKAEASNPPAKHTRVLQERRTEEELMFGAQPMEGNSAEAVLGPLKAKIEQYLSAYDLKPLVIDLKQCPLDWWWARRAEMPQLDVVAQNVFWNSGVDCHFRTLVFGRWASYHSQAPPAFREACSQVYVWPL